MTATEVATNPTAQQAYLDWLNLPLTKMILDLVDSEGHCQRPDPPMIKAEVALMAVGENLGWHGAVQRMRSLHVVAKDVAEELQATYGANKKDYFKDDKNKPGTGKEGKQ